MMDLIQALKTDAELADFIQPSCTDEGIEVHTEDGVDASSIAVIKVDDFYNSFNIEKRPASIDCLIIQYCGDNNYRLYLIELKNVENANSISNKN